MPLHPRTACSGANVTARNEDNQTPVDLAEERGDEELADLLTQRQRLQRLQTTSNGGARRLCSNLSSRNITPTEGESWLADC